MNKHIDNNKYSEAINAAIEVLKAGGVILYPTDTIWGIGCDATNSQAVARVLSIKHRADSKSLITLVSDTDMLAKYVKEIPDIALDLIEVNDRPMTIIYPRAIVATDSSLQEVHLHQMLFPQMVALEYVSPTILFAKPSYPISEERSSPLLQIYPVTKLPRTIAQSPKRSSIV